MVKRPREVAVASSSEPFATLGEAVPTAIASAPKRKRKDSRKDAVAPLDALVASHDNSSSDAAASASAVLPDNNPRYPAVQRRTAHKKKKTLVVCSRGVTSTNVELMEDLLKLMPHARKDPKFDKSEPLTSLGEIAELNGCAAVLYFEARKMKDLYLWVGAVKAGGPCAKFLVQQVRPMKDLRLTGNCLLGSRPILSFDGAFDGAPYLQLLKQLLAHAFAPPKGHPRSKPFHDHVLSFSVVGGRVLVRHYQVVPPLHDAKKEGDTLVEIGPRLALVPIRILGGVFAGETLYVNDTYQSPNLLRAEQKRRSAKRTIGHVAQKEKRRSRLAQGADQPPADDLADVFAVGE